MNNSRAPTSSTVGKSLWLPTAFLEGTRPTNRTCELAVVLAEAYGLAGHPHRKLQWKLTFLGLMLALAGAVLLALFGAARILGYSSIVAAASSGGAVALLLAAAGMLVYGNVIHKPLKVQTIRKVWWKVHLVPYRSNRMMIFDASGAAPKMALSYYDIPLTEIGGVVAGVPEPRVIEDERRLDSGLATLKDLCAMRETFTFQTAALQAETPYSRAVVALSHYLEPGRPEVSSQGLSLEGALAQRDRLAEIEASGTAVAATLRNTTAALETKVSAFNRGLDQSLSSVHKYVSTVSAMLTQRWLGPAKVQKEPTTLESIAVERRSSAAGIEKFSYKISSLRVTEQDDSGPATALSILSPIIAPLEERTKSGVIKTVQSAVRVVAEKQQQADDRINRFRVEYRRRIQRTRQEGERLQGEADRLNHRLNDLSDRRSRAQARAGAALDRSRRAREREDQNEVEAQKNESDRANEEAQRLWEDMVDLRRQQAERLAIVRQLRIDADREQQELERQVASVRNETSADIRQHQQSVREEIRLDRGPLDALYQIRDEQLAMLLEAVNVLDAEKRSQCEPFLFRRKRIRDATAEVLSSLSDRQEERQNVLNTIGSFKISQPLQQPTQVHIPFWEILAGERATEQRRYAIPPRRIEHSAVPRFMEEPSPLSPSLETIAVQVVRAAEVSAEPPVVLPLQYPDSRDLADQLDRLVSDQVMAKGYARSIKKFFGLDRAIREA